MTVTESDSAAGGSCADEEVITRTWTATDDCGNASSCDQIITVIDRTAPVIACPADQTVDCTSSIGTCAAAIVSAANSTDPTATSSATATDNCDTDVAISFSDSVMPGTCANEKEITRTWTATDNCGNIDSCDQIINVVDNSAPVITCPASLTIECDASNAPAATGSATATDNCDNAPVISFADSITSSSCPDASTITRTWTATDACGNSADCNQTITTRDIVAPVITCPDLSLIHISEPTRPY